MSRAIYTYIPNSLAVYLRQHKIGGIVRLGGIKLAVYWSMAGSGKVYFPGGIIFFGAKVERPPYTDVAAEKFSIATRP